MASNTSPVEVRDTFITLTTNVIGPEARAPFLQAEGHQLIYPYNRRDHLLPKWRTRRWRALQIENEYLRATVLPELGGRLFSLYDKVAGREVFTSPNRFRFARIHLRGAWAPVGIEFNFPIGHTVASTIPVTCILERHEDGSASIVSGAVSLVTGMHWEVRMTLRPGVGRLFFHNRFANPTPLPHGAMFWHNASVLVSEGFRFQSRANMAHVLEDIGPFPWRHGRDYTWYKNRLWSMDLFLVDVPEDWFGYYNHDIEYGALHLADRRTMPGKKFFSWGASADGRTWSRTFGLDGRHYGELQTGFLDTQSQKARFEPGRVFESDECWFPIAGTGDILQCNEHLALGLRPSAGASSSRLTLVATESLGRVTVSCWDLASGRKLLESTARPEPLRMRAFALKHAPGAGGVRVRVENAEGVLLDREVPPLKEPTARQIAAARARIQPKHPKTPAGHLAAAIEAANFHLYSAAERHLRQALERHPRLAAAHVELGWLALRRLDFDEAERCFQHAVELQPNDPAAKAAHQAARLGFMRQNDALATDATHPLTLIRPWLEATSDTERRRTWRQFVTACAADVQVPLEAAVILAEIGALRIAADFLETVREDRRFPRHPMLGYLAAHWSSRITDLQAVEEWLDWAQQCPAERVNPSRPEEVHALRWAIRERPKDANAHLFLGNWLASRGQEAEALREWRKAIQLNPKSGLAHRNVGFTLFRHGRRLTEALEHYRAALAAYPDEIDFYLEAVRVLMRLGKPAECVTLLESAPADLRKADKWIKAYALALQDAGRPADALAAMSGPDLIPWEGERTLRRAWVECHLALGRDALDQNDLDRAEHHFTESIRYPPNLLCGEPYHTEQSIGLYHLGLVAERRGHAEAARACHVAAAEEMHRLNRHLHATEAICYSALSALRLGRRAFARQLLAPFVRQWKHLRTHTDVTLNEWMGFDDYYRHPFGVGLALKVLGRSKEAKEAFRIVLDRYGPHPEALYHLKTLS
jgi:tetratricopeptide (TPR) repeat protein